MISTRFTATEWLTGNMHRAYPLDDSTAGVCPIPSALLADMFILVSGAVDDLCSFYISEVRTTDTSVVINIAGEVAGDSLSSTPVATFPIGGELGSVASSSIPLSEYTIHVKIVAGDLSVAATMPAYSVLDEESGKLFTGCVRGVPNLGSGAFVINGSRVSGDLTLNAGNGIDFEVSNFEAKIHADVNAVTPVGEVTTETIDGTMIGMLSGVPEENDNSESLENYSISYLYVDDSGQTTAIISDGQGNMGNFTGSIMGSGGLYLSPDPGTYWEVGAEGTDGSGGGGSGESGSGSGGSGSSGSGSGSSGSGSSGVARVSDVSRNPGITINATDFTIPEENLVITDDASLLAAAIKEYGIPIRSINGVNPNSNGNITIAPDEVTVESEESEEANFYASIGGSGAGAVQIKLSHKIPCPSVAIIDTVMANIAVLNDRASELNKLITKLDTANSNLAVKVAEMTQ